MFASRAGGSSSFIICTKLTSPPRFLVRGLSISSVSKDMQTPVGQRKYKLRLRGDGILTSPRWNKGTAFTKEERQRFGLTGRLPYMINSLEDQCRRAYDQLASQDNNLQKNAFLQSMKAQNWVLYYALLERHLKELMPIIYTPTEVSMIRHLKVRP